MNIGLFMTFIVKAAGNIGCKKLGTGRNESASGSSMFRSGRVQAEVMTIYIFASKWND